MEFRILGPIEVVEDGVPLRLGGLKPRAVLAHLLLRANRVVPADVLIDELWGEDPPEDARNALQTHVSRLRAVLGEDRLESRPPGYAVRVGPDELDLLRFERLVADGRDQVAGDPGAGARDLSEALGLWRGPALADLAGEPSFAGEIARLEELRLAALEERIAADLALGRHAGLVAELDALTHEHPLRERLWGNLMLALYRSGRQADALAAYRRARAVLSEELGVDPSRRLQRLHDQILGQDPSLSIDSRPIVRPAAAASGELPAGTEIAGYRIEDLLGRGGMSTVYLAEDLRLRRRVALKILAPELSNHPGFRERFIRESRIAAGIEHPGIVPIYEAGEAGELLFIAMRYVPGTDLRRLIADAGPLAPERAIRIATTVAEALDAAHAEGLVHRDVKPANILLVERGGSAGRDLVYLSDFGLTKRLEGESGRLTKTGQFVGTVDYVAPEQIEGRDVDRRADVYALACVLFECLTGRAPHRRDSEVATLYAHLSPERPRLRDARPDLPDRLDEVLAVAMDRSPARRPSSAGELAAEAAAAVEPAVDRPAGRGRLVPAGIVVAALTLAAIVFAVTRSSAPEGSEGSVSPTPSPTRVFTVVDREPTEAEQRLLALVPGSIRAGCEPAEPRTPRIDPDEGATAAVACLDGETEVLYEKFESRDLMDVAFGNRVNAAAAHGGDCATDHVAQNTYTVDGTARGRVMCDRGEDRSVIAWTDEDLQVLGHAVRGDLGDQSLYEWWLVAGPTLGDSAPGKDGPVEDDDSPAGVYVNTLTPEQNRLLPPHAQVTSPTSFVLRLVDGDFDITIQGNQVESGTYVLSKGQEIVFGSSSACVGTSSWEWRHVARSLRLDLDISSVVDRTCIPGPAPAVVGSWFRPPSGEIALDGGGDLYVQSIDGFEHVPLTGVQGETADDGQPVWSPDGDRIAFTSDRGGSPDLYVMNPDGSEVLGLTHDPATESDPDWSPDGSTIVFVTGAGSSTALAAISPDGSGERTLVDGDRGTIARPSWAPDGSSIVFTIDGALHVVDADGSNVRVVPNAEGLGPVWTPEGARIVFWDPRADGLVSVAPDGSDRAPFTTTPAASVPVRLDWSSDGRWIVQGGLWTNDFTLPVTVVSSDGKRLVVVTASAAEPTWRPDPSA